MEVTAELADPGTPALRLAHIAQAHPEHAAAIAQHPNAYPELVAWAQQVQNTRTPTPAAFEGTVTTNFPSAPRWSRFAWMLAGGLFIVAPFVQAMLRAIAPESFYGMLNPEYGIGIEFWLGMGATRINPFVAMMLIGFPAALVGAIGAPTAARRAWAIVVWFFALVLEFLPLFFGWTELPTPMAPVPYEWRALAVVLVGFVLSTLLLTAWILSWPLSGRACFAIAVLFAGTLLLWLLPITYQGIFGIATALIGNLFVPVGVIMVALVFARPGAGRS